MVEVLHLRAFATPSTLATAVHERNWRRQICRSMVASTPTLGMGTSSRQTCCDSAGCDGVSGPATALHGLGSRACRRAAARGDMTACGCSNWPWSKGSGNSACERRRPTVACGASLGCAERCTRVRLCPIGFAGVRVRRLQFHQRSLIQRTAVQWSAWHSTVSATVPRVCCYVHWIRLCTFLGASQHVPDLDP